MQCPRGLIRYGYDAAGRRISLSYSSGMTQFGYDVDDYLVKVTNPWGEVTSYSWDLAHRLTMTQLPNGTVVNRSYDNASRLTYIGDPSGGTG